MTTARPRGLGDSPDMGLKRVGIHQAVKAVESVTDFGCGCAKRRDKPNALVPY